MTKTHHCPGMKKKIHGLPGNCRPGAGLATGSCATHQTVCKNIVEGKYCKGKHMKNEPCSQCGQAAETKAAETKAAEAKTAEAKAAQAKTAETKAAEAKTAEGKATKPKR